MSESNSLRIKSPPFRRLVQPQHWKHCPGTENPANISFRGMAASSLLETSLWLQGPHWLCSEECHLGESSRAPLKSNLSIIVGTRWDTRNRHTLSLLPTTIGQTLVSSSTLKTTAQLIIFIWVTALVLKFVRNIWNRIHNPSATGGTTLPWVH